MLVKMALYGLNSSGAAFQSKLAGVLRDIGYLFTKGDPNVWIQPAVKPDGIEYHEIVLCYVDDVLAISATPMKNIEGIKSVFKFKGDKAEVPDMYIGASIQKLETADGTECWAEESIPGNSPPPRGKPVYVGCYVDANHAGNLLTRRSHTGIVIFVNNSPIIWYSKRQNTVDSSIIGSE